MVVVSLLCLTHAASVRGQETSATDKVYRGSIGNSHVEMRLSFQGNKVSGSYSYDRIREDLKLTGRLDEQGRLELAEFGAKGKQTGKFICKKRLEEGVDSECTWSKPDGTRQAMVTLEEQHVAFTNGLQITPKTILDKKASVSVSYPQITSGKALNSGALSFNRRILELVQKAIKEFQPIDDKGVFETTYNILLGTNDLVSIEMAEYWDGGGAHPNTRLWSLTYDLAGNKELTFESLFKPGIDYFAAIAKYVVADIDRRAAAIEQEDARQAGRQPKERDQPIVSEDSLEEISGWAMTPKGLVVYFDFPHVIAVFDKTFVPYNAVSEYLRPNGPAARFHKN